VYIGTMFCLAVKFLANTNDEEDSELDDESLDYSSQNTTNGNLLDLKSLKGSIKNNMDQELLH